MVTNETEEFCACGVTLRRGSAHMRSCFHNAAISLTKVSIHFSGSAREIPLFFIIISVSSSVSLLTRRLSTFSFLDDVLLTDAVAKWNERRLVNYNQVLLKTLYGPCGTCEAILNVYGLASLKDEVGSIAE